VEFYDVVLAVVKMVDVTPRFRHQPTLNQASAFPAISLPDLGKIGDAHQRCFEFINEEFLAIWIFSPPRVFGFKLRAGFIE
jgi:hypothetical protein